MERLTCNELNKLTAGCYFVNFASREEAAKYRMLAESAPKYEEIYRKLAEYENAEEQGLLIKLPCKVGDVVWDIDYGKLCAYTITGYSFGTAEDYIDDPVKENEIVYYYKNSNGSISGSFASSEIGKSLFLNKEEAEQALEQMGE